MTKKPIPDLSCFLAPRRVAIVGASSDPVRIGGRPIAYMKKLGFSGDILPVNPSRAEIQGLKAYPDLSAIDGTIDLVIIAVPTPHVAKALVDAAHKGATGAVIFSSGFAEIGGEGIAQQDNLAQLARQHGIRVVGPNSLGVFSAVSGVAATFSSFLEQDVPRDGNIAIVSQSGAFGAHLSILAIERGLRLRHWITTGNEMDLGTSDFIAAMAADPAVSVIGVYAETVGDGRAFLDAVAAARRAGKAVVVMKVGRTVSGSNAAASHTASLAGDDAVFAAALDQAGGFRVLRTDAFVDAIYALSLKGAMQGDKLGILTVSGGAGVLMADAASDAGLTLPPMPVPSQTALRSIVPFGSPVNPVDVTAQALNDMTLVGRHLHEMFDQGGYDGVAGFFMNWVKSPTTGVALRATVADAMAGFKDRVFAIAANATPDVIADFEAIGALVFEDPTRTINAMAAMHHQGAATPTWQRTDTPLATNPFKDGRLNEAGLKELLGGYGLTFPTEYVSADADQAALAANRIDGPIAIKILSPDIAHKSEVGGVALDIIGSEQARSRASQMLHKVSLAAPQARIDGVLVSPMLSGVAECIVGARQDPAFGTVVIVGLGGIFTEIMGDVALNVGPVTEAQALTMIRRLRGWTLLNGARGRPLADVAALAASVAALSRFAHAHRDCVTSVELNPVMVHAAGQGVVALDAAVEVTP